MFAKKIIYLFLFLLHISCYKNNNYKGININNLNSFLIPKNSNRLPNQKIKTNYLEATIIRKKTNETDIWIESKNKKIYKLIRDYYNQELIHNNVDTILNSWTNDSLEFTLFQKSDSMILVSIFEKE